MTAADGSNGLERVHRSHPRTWRENRYVYPVISRRSGGLSIGVNLNPDKVCNFHCIYCQVDRQVEAIRHEVDPEQLRSELTATVQAAVEGDLFREPPFDEVPADRCVIRDIALSGDGEPTTSPHFGAAVDMAADVKRAFGLDDVKIVLITNAACLDRPAVRDGLARMDANHGEIWAKLDAGTESYFRLINRAHVPFRRILDNIRQAARVRPVVIQSLWMNVNGSPPPDAEVDALGHRLREILADGGRISRVQVYTTARQTAEPYVTAVDDKTLVRIADRIKAIADVPVETFGQ